MAISILGPFNKIINDTATEIVNSQLPDKVSGVLATLIKSSFSAVDNLLIQVQDLTKPEPPAPATPPPAPATPPANATPPPTGSGSAAGAGI
jgi:hypothetical protein